MGQAKRDRTSQIIRKGHDGLAQEFVRNEIEQYNFDKLIEAGVVVAEPEAES